MSGQSREILGLRDQFWSNQPYDAFKPSLAAVTRNLFVYQTVLRFNPNLFQGASVLDFGCGATNLKVLLEKEGVKPKVVHMVDVDPNVRRVNPRAITFDGRGLRSHFKTGSVDYTLASASTFQINPTERPRIFDQLLQITGKATHLAPVYAPDFTALEELAKKRGFEIVACRPYTATEPMFRPRRIEDYQDFIDSYSADERIIPPIANEPVYKFRLFLFYNLDLTEGSSYIILRRTQG